MIQERLTGTSKAPGRSIVRKSRLIDSTQKVIEQTPKIKIHKNNTCEFIEYKKVLPCKVHCISVSDKKNHLRKYYYPNFTGEPFKVLSLKYKLRFASS